MNRIVQKTPALVAASVFAVALGSAGVACSSTLSAGSDQPLIEAGAKPSTNVPDAGGLVAPRAEAGPGICNAYECPAPYATCPGTSGLCTTNLATDIAHCGGCDSECPNSLFIRQRLHASFLCSKGRCEMTCTELAGDCNHLVDDGCETPLDSDPKNCGGCGITCAPNEICWNGGCGCPSGYAQCGDECVQLDSNDSHCGACDHACDQVPLDGGTDIWPCGPGVTAPNTALNCAQSQCGLHCAPEWGDCNPDHCGDGCETHVTDDHEHCGACGHACAPEQICSQGKCICDDLAHTRCGDECVDLQTDANNCGACGNRCPGLQGDGFTLRGSPVCELGRCAYRCPPGSADCDHRIENGCEADLMSDPWNCGACGHQCDLAGGQPCGAGTCLTKPCDGTVQ